jgi:hypothetical protein
MTVTSKDSPLTNGTPIKPKTLSSRCLRTGKRFRRSLGGCTCRARKSAVPGLHLSGYGVNQAVSILICSAASPPCLDPGLPTHITRQSTVLEVYSSKMSSTNCPRLRREVPPILKPSCELSRMRHGILCACRPCLTIRLARFFRAVRFNRRRWGLGRLNTAILPWS